MSNVHTLSHLHVAGQPAAAKTEQCDFRPWRLSSCKSHILESQGSKRERFAAELSLPHLPDMIFADNKLRVEHEAGFGIEFSALEALKLVDATHESYKVAGSQLWKEARAECGHINEVVKPFDWTFSTDYSGTVFGQNTGLFSISDTDERIDLERLKKRENILFYEDIALFEDEMADNGSSTLSVKVRVMPSGFFILLRFFMRIDDVAITLNETRIYYQAGTTYLIREFTNHHDKISDITAPVLALSDPNEIGKYLTARRQTFEKLDFSKTRSTLPAKDSDET